MDGGERYMETNRNTDRKMAGWAERIYVYIYKYIYIYILCPSIYIYIYIEREREREQDRLVKVGW